MCPKYDKVVCLAIAMDCEVAVRTRQLLVPAQGRGQGGELGRGILTSSQHATFGTINPRPPAEPTTSH